MKVLPSISICIRLKPNYLQPNNSTKNNGPLLAKLAAHASSVTVAENAASVHKNSLNRDCLIKLVNLGEFFVKNLSNSPETFVLSATTLQYKGKFLKV